MRKMRRQRRRFFFLLVFPVSINLYNEVQENALFAAPEIMVSSIVLRVTGCVHISRASISIYLILDLQVLLLGSSFRCYLPLVVQ